MKSAEEQIKHVHAMTGAIRRAQNAIKELELRKDKLEFTALSNNEAFAVTVKMSGSSDRTYLVGQDAGFNQAEAEAMITQIRTMIEYAYSTKIVEKKKELEKLETEFLAQFK